LQALDAVIQKRGLLKKDVVVTQRAGTEDTGKLQWNYHYYSRRLTRLCFISVIDLGSAAELFAGKLVHLAKQEKSEFWC
jgi:hypothetical protein